jgi:hypothetical protein
MPREERSAQDGAEDGQGTAGRALNRGFDAALVVVIMVVGSLVLWLGVPFAWLFIGGQVQGATDSIGLALGTALLGATLSILALGEGLARLNGLHQELQMRRGAQPTPLLEMVIVVTATIALVAFVLFFFVIEGPGPSIAPSR